MADARAPANRRPLAIRIGRMVLALAVSVRVVMWLLPRPLDDEHRSSTPHLSDEPVDLSDQPPAAYERRDVSAGAMAIGFGGVVLALAVSVGLAMWLYPQAVVDRRINTPLPTYPAPRLQENPAADLQHFYANEMARLNGAGWVDQAHGIAHIPIDQAMRMIARQGIPDWPGPKP